MNTAKTFRHGQILRLVTDARISNQEELRRRLAAQKLRVTQATLSRDLQELRLVKTHEGYKQEAALPEESTGCLRSTRALGEFLSRYSPGGEYARPEDASQRRAASRRRGRRREIRRNRRNHRRRRHRPDHHSGSASPANPCKRRSNRW